MPEAQLFYRGPFSQFHPRRLHHRQQSVRGRRAVHAYEQKARLSGDIAMAARILASSRNRMNTKMMGGAVHQASRSERNGTSAKVGIVTDRQPRASSARTPAYAESLLDTGDADHLAEASAQDFIWAVAWLARSGRAASRDHGRARTCWARS